MLMTVSFLSNYTTFVLTVLINLNLTWSNIMYRRQKSCNLHTSHTKIVQLWFAHSQLQISCYSFIICSSWTYPIIGPLYFLMPNTFVSTAFIYIKKSPNLERNTKILSPKLLQFVNIKLTQIRIKIIKKARSYFFLQRCESVSCNFYFYVPQNIA